MRMDIGITWMGYGLKLEALYTYIPRALLLLRLYVF